MKLLGDKYMSSNNLDKKYLKMNSQVFRFQKTSATLYQQYF